MDYSTPKVQERLQGVVQEVEDLQRDLILESEMCAWRAKLYTPVGELEEEWLRLQDTAVDMEINQIRGK